MTKQVDFNGADLDSMQSDPQPIEKKEKVKISFSIFLPVLCRKLFHDVFEHLDFDQPSTWVSLIEQKLSRHQFDSSLWLGPIKKMVDQVMEAELFPVSTWGLLPVPTELRKWSFLSLCSIQLETSLIYFRKNPPYFITFPKFQKLHGRRLK